MTDFHSAVAKRGKVTPQRVAEVLEAHGIESWTPPPPPGRLTVNRVSFEGTRDGERYEPFAWQPARGVWALGSEDNSVGKTTVLNVIRWLLSGRERVDDAARAMIDHAQLVVELAGETCTIDAQGNAGNVTGTVTVGAAEPIAFNQESFESTMSRIMLARLGLERTVGWQKYAGSQDGRQVQFDWASLLPGLFVPEAAYKVVLGDHAPSAGRLLQMFVGMPWFATHEAARVALSQFDQGRRDVERRAGRDADARDKRVEALEKELTEARGRLGGDASSAAARLTQAAAELDDARRAALEADTAWRAAESELRAAEAVERTARRRVRDLVETNAAAALFGTLQPARCPRCEQAITDERRAQEAEHVCSVCDRAQPDAPDDAEARLQEAEDQLAEAGDALAAARAAAEGAQVAAKAAARARDGAVDRYEDARRDVQAAQAQEAHRLAVARIEGKLEEVKREERPDQAQPVDHERKVLRAAEAEALERMQADGLLRRLDVEVLAVAQRLGLDDITGVALDRGAHMAVHKGPVRTNFGKLNLGERLRLKIATVIGLLRVGHPSRHPGLIVIDSPAAEEMADANLDLMLAELVGLASELRDLQVLLATTRVKSLSVLGEDRVRYVPAGQRLW